MRTTNVSFLYYSFFHLFSNLFKYTLRHSQSRLRFWNCSLPDVNQYNLYGSTPLRKCFLTNVYIRSLSYTYFNIQYPTEYNQSAILILITDDNDIAFLFVALFVCVIPDIFIVTHYKTANIAFVRTNDFCVYICWSYHFHYYLFIISLCVIASLFFLAYVYALMTFLYIYRARNNQIVVVCS